MANSILYWVTFSSKGVNADTTAYKVSLYEEISDEIEPKLIQAIEEYKNVFLHEN